MDNKKLDGIIAELRDMIAHGNGQVSADQLAKDEQRANEIAGYLYAELAALPPSERSKLNAMIQNVDAFAKMAMGIDDLAEGEIRITSLRHCYHYILDKHGDPVHCEDHEEVRRFQERKGHILAEDHPRYQQLRVEITTLFLVHNAACGDEVPPPRWCTILSLPAQTPKNYFYESAGDAMKGHDEVVEMVYRKFDDLRRKRGQQ